MTQHSCSQANRTVKVVLAEVERANHRRCLQETLLESFKGNVWYACVFLFVSLGARFALMQTEWDGCESERKAFFLSCACCGLLSLKWLVLSSETVSSTCQIEASKWLCGWEDTVQRHQQSHDIIVSRQLVISYPREMGRKSQHSVTFEFHSRTLF